MKRILSLIMVGFVTFAATSCKKYLDINTNPNTATSSTPELVLPQAITAIASQTVEYNFYGSQVAGYIANGGGVAFSGPILTYNYDATSQQALWNTSYDIANDVEYIITSTEGQPDLLYFNAAAKILKAFVFQRLVDQYNDAPYTDALKGANNVTPKYDKATDIYKSLGDLLDAGLTVFATPTNPATSAAFIKADVMFGGDKTRWAKFANTLKLRMVLRAGNKVAFTKTTFDTAVGFLTEDATVNPGYTKVSGKQNPTWNRFAYTFANATVTLGGQYPPTPFVRAFYDGTKLTDVTRANLVYKVGVAAVTNQLGNTVQSAGRGAVPNSWFRGTSATAYESIGIFKGFDAAQPVFLLADAYFLQAEANVRGILTGDAQANFNSGIDASFRYLNKNAANAVTAGKAPATEGAAYRTANATKYLANFALATTTEQKIEAIITQKYIALNFLFGDEAWNDYRRTGYPVSNSSPGAAPAETIVSIATESTAPDRLPARLQYPDTEFKYNSANVPTIDKYTTKIFWAR